MSTNLFANRRLAGNVIWNLLGQGLPLIAAVVFIPGTMTALGLERFGILSMAWVLIGYVSMLDLGVSRSLTQSVAVAVGRQDRLGVVQLGWSGGMSLVVLGIVAGTVVIVAAPWLATGVFHISPPVIPEAVVALRWLGASLPLVMLTAGLRGILEAHQWFGGITILRMGLGIGNFLLPWLIARHQPDLVLVVIGLLLLRVVVTAGHVGLCLHLFPGLWSARSWRWDRVRPLLREGGWMTVSNVIGSLSLYLDRLMLAGTMLIGQVVYYTTPFDLIFRTLIGPSAIAGVLFPAIAGTAASASGHCARLVRLGHGAVLLLIGPVCVVVAAGAPEGLQWWLGREFADQSSAVLRWLTLGIICNASAMIPFAAVQAVGRSAIAATLHLIELPLYVGGLWWCIQAYGIEGAAIAWTVRAAADACAVWVIHGVVVPSGRDILMAEVASMAAWAGACALVTMPAMGVWRWLVVLVVLAWAVGRLPVFVRQLLRDQDGRLVQKPPREDIAVEPVPHCLVCGSTGLPRYEQLEDRMFGVGGTWQMMACPNPTCRMLWLNPRPRQEDVGKVYRDYYTHSDQPHRGSWLGRVRRWCQGWMPGEKGRQRLRLLTPDLNPPGRLLEIGCGDGARLVDLHRQGWTVEGQDIDPAAGYLALKAGIPMHVGALDALPLPLGAYDVVVMNHVIEHVYEPVELLRRCRALLRPGGRFVSVAPNPSSLGLWWFGRAWFGLDVPRHLRLLTPDGYREVARRAGFTTIMVETTSANDFIVGSTSIAFRRARFGEGLKPLPWWCYGEVVAFQVMATIWFRMRADVGEECIVWAGD